MESHKFVSVIRSMIDKVYVYIYLYLCMYDWVNVCKLTCKAACVHQVSPVAYPEESMRNNLRRTRRLSMFIETFTRYTCVIVIRFCWFAMVLSVCYGFVAWMHKASRVINRKGNTQLILLMHGAKRTTITNKLYSANSKQQYSLNNNSQKSIFVIVGLIQK